METTSSTNPPSLFTALMTSEQPHTDSVQQVVTDPDNSHCTTVIWNHNLGIFHFSSLSVCLSTLLSCADTCPWPEGLWRVFKLSCVLKVHVSRQKKPLILNCEKLILWKCKAFTEKWFYICERLQACSVSHTASRKQYCVTGFFRSCLQKQILIKRVGLQSCFEDHFHIINACHGRQTAYKVNCCFLGQS